MCSSPIGALWLPNARANELVLIPFRSYGMKTALSIPDDILEGADQLARKTKRSRSRLFSDALKEYLARHASDKITEAMDQARREIAGKKEPLVSSAARRVLEKSEW